MEPRTTTQQHFVEGLWRSYRVPLLAYLTQMLGDPELAHEVAQDSLERIHSAYSPDQIEYPRAVLFKVATRLALMHLRHRSMQRRVIGEAIDLEEVPDDRTSPDQEAIRGQLAQYLASVIKELPVNLRNVFVMAHVQGKPRKEIAIALGITEKRLDKRMTKALRTCRERLASWGRSARLRRCAIRSILPASSP